MPEPRDTTVGANIRRFRVHRGLTQTELAARVGISDSHVSQVERGVKSLSMATLNRFARELSVHPSDLTGQPYIDELADDRLHELVQPIRAALDLWDIPPDQPTRHITAIAHDVERMCAAVRRTDLRTVAAALPGLLEEATTAAHTIGTDQAWATLASLYRTAYDVAAKLGYHDLSSLGLDRMAWAAERASDAAVVAMRQYMRALVHLRSGTYIPGQRLIETGHALLQQAERTPARDAVTGQLYLGQAVIAARAGHRDTALDYLDQADRIAAITGEVPRIHWLSFGPTNATVHRVSVLSELSDDAAAVSIAERLTLPEDWPASRLAHHHVEVARAYHWTGRSAEAQQRLLTARQVAPQQTRYLPQARQLVDQLVKDASTRQDNLIGLSKWFHA